LIYINGIQAASTGSITIPASSASSLRLGMERTGGNYFNGAIWLPQIWGEALPATSVANLYFIESFGQPWPNSAPGAGAYVSNGLVEWNKFNDGSGTIAADSSGNSNALPLVGGPSWGSDYLSFNGSTQYGDAGSNQLSFLDLHDLTICAWINKTGSSFKGIIDKSYVQTGVGYGGWSLRVLAGNQLDWWVENGQDITDNGTETIAPGQWTFVTVAWHYATTEADFYLNGVLNSKVTKGAADEGGSGPAHLEVGNMQNNLSGGEYAFDGSMYDVGIYNRVLSAAEVESNFLATESSTNVSAPDLLYYKMTEYPQTNPPVFLADSSTHGGATGTVWSAYPLQWVTNIAFIPNTALHFNGVSTYIDTSNSVLFNFTTNLFTINLWVRPLTANGCLLENGIFQSNGWYLNVGGSYQIQFGAESNGTDVSVSTQAGAAQVGQFTMVTIVRTGPTNAIVYINGIQAATTGSITTPASSSYSLRFGMDRAGAHYLDGDIWMPQVWGEALPATAIANLYFRQSTGQPWP
jgi:hypothetical protein